MKKEKKLKSLSIFFPFYNDAGTVKQAIRMAYEIGNTLTKDLEVIALHGGNSKDDTMDQIKKMKKKYPALKIIDKTKNTEGYAVIKYGFQAALKDWVFYTDGDLQYDLSELPKLVLLQFDTHCDVVNGYKYVRSEKGLRTWLGNGYAGLSKFFFQLPIRDTDCDFRLIRNAVLKKFRLDSHDASILPELLVKLKKNGAIFREIPVTHRDRTYGVSNYSVWGLIKEKIAGDVKLWWRLK